MARNKNHPLRNEFIGSRVEVSMSKNPSNERIRGTIVDETMKSFIVKTSSGEKRLIKSDCIFKIKSDNWKGTVDGKSLVGRPEERIKKK